MINIKSVILSLLLLFPSTVYSDSWKEWLKQDLYEDQFLEQTEDIIIDAPYRALDGGNVPITIATKSKDIVKLTLIIDENPTPCCASFEFKDIIPYIETNIRVNAYTHLTVVGEDKNGKLYVNRKFIKAAGGCSAAPIVNSDTPQNQIDIFSDEWIFAKKKIQFNHPNYSGLQFNQLTRTEIPADYIDTVVITTEYGEFKYEYS